MTDLTLIVLGLAVILNAITSCVIAYHVMLLARAVRVLSQPGVQLDGPDHGAAPEAGER